MQLNNRFAESPQQTVPPGGAGGASSTPAANGSGCANGGGGGAGPGCANGAPGGAAGTDAPDSNGVGAISPDQQFNELANHAETPSSAQAV